MLNCPLVTVPFSPLAVTGGTLAFRPSVRLASTNRLPVVRSGEVNGCAASSVSDQSINADCPMLKSTRLMVPADPISLVGAAVSLRFSCRVVRDNTPPKTL